MASVRFLNGPNSGQTITLKGGELIGRDPKSTIQIAVVGVSRKHFRFVCQGKAFMVEDLGSSNGTYVNSRRVTKHTLEHADTITVGGINLLFTGDGKLAKGMVPLREDEEDEVGEDFSVKVGSNLDSASIVGDKAKVLQQRLSLLFEVSI